MIVECPYCHRRYEPKPNEKYCPCCGEEIKEPLKEVVVDSNNDNRISKEQDFQAFKRRRFAKKITGIIAGTLIALSLLFVFSSLTSGVSLFYCTFFLKNNEGDAYVWLIIAFIVYAISYLGNIYGLVKSFKEEETNVTKFVGIANILLVVFYIIYLTAEFTKKSGSGSYYSYFSFSDGLIKYFACLVTGSITYFVSRRI